MGGDAGKMWGNKREKVKISSQALNASLSRLNIDWNASIRPCIIFSYKRQFGFNEYGKFWSRSDIWKNIRIRRVRIQHPADNIMTWLLIEEWQTTEELILRSVNFHGQQLASFMKEVPVMRQIETKKIDYHLYQQVCLSTAPYQLCWIYVSASTYAL